MVASAVNGLPVNKDDEGNNANKGPGVILTPATIVQAKDMPLIIIPNGQPVYIMPPAGRLDDNAIQQPVLLGAGEFVYGGAPGFGGILFGRK